MNAIRTIIIILPLLLFSNIGRSQTPDPLTVAEVKAWQSDWASFLKETEKKMDDEAKLHDFYDKTVEWSGQVTAIMLEGDKSQVTLKMQPEVVGRFTIADLNLSPQPDELETWQGVQVGDHIVFRTKLGTDEKVWFFMFMNDGKRYAALLMKGGSFVRKTRPTE